MPRILTGHPPRAKASFGYSFGPDFPVERLGACVVDRFSGRAEVENDPVHPRP